MLIRSKWFNVVCLVAGLFLFVACNGEETFVDEEPEEAVIIVESDETESDGPAGGNETTNESTVSDTSDSSVATDEEPTTDDSDSQVDDSNDQLDDSSENQDEDATTEDNMDADYQTVAYAQWTDDARLYPFEWFNHQRSAQWVIEGEPTRAFTVTLENSTPMSLTHYIVDAMNLPDNELYSNMSVGVFENSSYFYAPQVGCLWSSEGEGNQAMRNFNTDSFLSFGMGDKPGLVYEGMETLHGLETYVFTMGIEALTREWEPEAPGAEIYEASARVHLYPISEEVSLIVAAELMAVSNYDTFAEAFVERVTNYYNVGIHNVGVQFEARIPEECLEQQESLTTDYPVFPGATPLGGAQGITVLIVTDVTAEEVAAWYEQSYLEDEWTLINKNELVPGAIMIDFSKNGESVSITITTDPQSGDINIAFIDF